MFTAFSGFNSLLLRYDRNLVTSRIKFTDHPLNAFKTKSDLTGRDFLHLGVFLVEVGRGFLAGRSRRSFQANMWNQIEQLGWLDGH